jgi:hypothetical protein
MRIRKTMKRMDFGNESYKYIFWLDLSLPSGVNVRATMNTYTRSITLDNLI